MTADSVILDRVARDLVEQTIGDVCAHSDWRLLAVNARSNHVHVVVCAEQHTPERVMNAFKSWCSRRLNELRGTDNRWWSRHGSTRWLNREEDVHAVIHYVTHQQDGDRFNSQAPARPEAAVEQRSTRNPIPNTNRPLPDGRG